MAIADWLEMLGFDRHACRILLPSRQCTEWKHKEDEHVWIRYWGAGTHSQPSQAQPRSETIIPVLVGSHRRGAPAAERDFEARTGCRQPGGRQRRVRSRYSAMEPVVNRPPAVDHHHASVSWLLQRIVRWPRPSAGRA